MWRPKPRIYYHPDMICRLAAVFVILVAACEGKGDKQAPIEPPDLQMVSAGNAPRKLLRYHVPKGTSQGLEVTIDMTLQAGEMGGPVPTIVMSMLLAAEDVTADGTVKLHTTIVDVTARDRADSKIPASALAGPLEAMKGIALTSTLAPNGRVGKSQVEGGKQLPADVAAQLTALTSSFENVVMPLPNEPIGVGAVWRNSRELSQNGMKLTTVNTFNVIAITGDKIEYTMETQVHGADQKITQAGTTVDITDVTGAGGGKGTLHLDKLAFESELTAQLRSKMQAPGESTATPMMLTTQMRAHPATATAPAAPADAGAAPAPEEEEVGSASSTGRPAE
jgi:hypothetical protein